MPDDAALNKRLTERRPDYIVNDEGDICIEKKGQRVEPSSGDVVSYTYRVNLTTLFRTPPRKTGNVDHLVIEAELFDETGEVGNPAYPLDEETEQAARTRIEQKSLTPAWEAVQ